MTATIKAIIETLTEGIEPIPNTVDKLEPGEPESAVTGIVTTFAATRYVVERAIELGANLIVSHEGIYYSHRGGAEAWPNDPVCRAKAERIREAGLSIFRYHDYAHRRAPDLITEGLVEALGWAEYVEEHRPEAALLTIPPMGVREIAEHLRTKLGLSVVRAAGDLTQTCRRVGVLVGFRGGGSVAIPLFESGRLDLIVAGEGPEWETPEYVRDAVLQGGRKTLLTIGHAESEAPGMKRLAAMLQAKYPDVPVHFVADRPVFELL